MIKRIFCEKCGKIIKKKLFRIHTSYGSLDTCSRECARKIHYKDFNNFLEELTLKE